MRMTPNVFGCAMSLAVAALAMALSAAPARAEPVIKWRVENPFRFFADPADTEVHRSSYVALSAEDRRKGALGRGDNSLGPMIFSTV